MRFLLENKLTTENQESASKPNTKWEQLVNVNHQKKDKGITPLFEAIKTGDLAMVKLLEELGAELDIECQVKPGQSLVPLLWACKLGQAEIAKFLIDKLEAQKKLKLDVAVSNSDSNCACLAATSGSLQLLLVLANSKFDLFHPNKNGDTPLHIAIRLGY